MKIDWRKRVRQDGHVVLYETPLYTIEFTERSRIAKIYGFNIILPVEPPNEDCINFGLSEKDQIFRKTFIPADLSSWKEDEEDKFIAEEWHRRRNGIWIFIKGKKYYIPGPAYFFFTYWKSQTGEKLIYRYTDLKFFMAWFHTVYDPKSFGLDVFKCRQIGDTEKAICILYEYTSRVRGTKAAMQSVMNLEHIQKTYNRMVYAHQNMAYYFQPINRGTSAAASGLEFNYPLQHITKNKIEERQLTRTSTEDATPDYEYKEINSQIMYGPSTEKHFDGQTFGRYYLDEFGKATSDMNPVRTIGVIREAIRNHITGGLRGKMLLTSTVEEMKGGDSLKWAKQIWNQSDPSSEKRNANGETVNGLYRVFRGALDRAQVDHWGFPKEEEEKAKIQNTIKSLMDAGDIKGVIEYRRKNCITIEDVFMSANDNSQFDIEKLSARMMYLENEVTKRPWVRGNLKWKDGIKDSEVIWEPNMKGKFVISKHPKDFGLDANKKVAGVISAKPGNTQHFCCGVDPIDQQSALDSDPSYGAFVIKAKLNMAIDGGEDRYYQFDDPARGIHKGKPVNGGFDFVTNRIVLTYINRPENPDDFFEDLILASVYYGTDFLPEKNKSGALHSYLRQRNYELYLMEKPTSFKNYRGQMERDGVTATTGSIETYFNFLTTLSTDWANTIDHPALLEQLLSMNWENRGKKDLGVAAGWCEYADKMIVRPSRSFDTASPDLRHLEWNYV